MHATRTASCAVHVYVTQLNTSWGPAASGLHCAVLSLQQTQPYSHYIRTPSRRPFWHVSLQTRPSLTLFALPTPLTGLQHSTGVARNYFSPWGKRNDIAPTLVERRCPRILHNRPNHGQNKPSYDQDLCCAPLWTLAVPRRDSSCVILGTRGLN